MPIELGWQEIVLRLTMTVIAGALIGVDRGQHGRPVGLRTILLVCLASALSMIQANLLLASGGKTADSFVTLDLMRLPLGILTGMGFIGAGAILKRDDIVVGVTTAATLWFVTVLGLCFGGGQIALGLGALALGMIVLKVLKHVEDWLPQDQRATLALTGELTALSDEELLADFERHGFRLLTQGIRLDSRERVWTVRCEVRWRARPGESHLPGFVRELSRRPGITMLEWNPVGHPNSTVD